MLSAQKVLIHPTTVFDLSNKATQKEGNWECSLGKSGKKMNDLIISGHFQDSIFSCEETVCYTISTSKGETKEVKGLDDFSLANISKGSVVYNDALWVVHNGDLELTSTFLSVDEVTDGPSYPEGRVGACNVQINETHALVTGGLPNDTTTMFINFETQEWSPGPELNYARSGHQCGRLIIDGQNVALGKL